MTITANDVMWYWSAQKGLLLPTVGSVPTFARAGNAFRRGVDGRHIILPTDTPRFEPEGLLLERAQTNELTGPFDINTTATPWSGNTLFTVTEAPSIYEGETAWRHANLGAASSRARGQVIGVWTNETESLSIDVENVDSVSTAIGMRDTDNSVWIGLGVFTWATGSIVDHGTSVGTDLAFEARRLSVAGPSGGEVYRLTVKAKIAAIDAGNARRDYLYLTGVGTNTDTAIIHAVNHVESGHIGSPADASRVTETMYWSPPPKAQAMVAYYRTLLDSSISEISAESAVRFWSIYDDAYLHPGIYVGIDTASSGRYFVQHEAAAGDSSFTSANGFAFAGNDLCECVMVLFANGSVRIMGRTNGGAITASTLGLTPTAATINDWSEDKLAINSHGSTTYPVKGHQHVQQLTMVKLAALDSPTNGDDDDSLMKEIAGFYMAPGGQSISNVRL